MEMPFGLYPRFYVKRKDQLFPVIEKYTGNKIVPGTPHGKIIPEYFRLLRTNDAFRAEVDALIDSQAGKLMNNKEKIALKQAAAQNKGVSVESNLHGMADPQNANAYNNAVSDWRILNIFRSEEDKVPISNGLFGGTSEKTLAGETSPTYSTGTGLLSSITSAVGNIFGYAAESKSAQAQSDAAFMEIVLNEQKQDDTMKILVISGITLAFVALGVYFVLKTKKS